MSMCAHRDMLGLIVNVWKRIVQPQPRTTKGIVTPMRCKGAVNATRGGVNVIQVSLENAASVPRPM